MSKTPAMIAIGAVFWIMTLPSHAQPAGLVGQWEFNGNLNAAVGSPLQYQDGEGGQTDQETQFGTTTTFGLPNMGGSEAQVMKFPASTSPMGYLMPTPMSPNGGGSLVNDWTLIFDLLYPAESDRQWRALIDTDQDMLSADSELFINTANGIGISSQYAGQIVSNTWHRVGFVIEGSAGVMRKYIDGAEVGTQTIPLDNRWALPPGSAVELFSDNDGENATGYVNSLQLREIALTAGQMKALGGASASGIPRDIPTTPSFVESRQPAPDTAGVSPRPEVHVVLNQGESTITPGSIRLLLDGTELPASITAAVPQYTIQYAITNFLQPKSVHTLSLVYSDTLGPKSNAWSFTVNDYKSINLPAPIYLETFDQIEEGALPSGWSVTNWTDVAMEGYDLDNANSDAYLDFVVISAERMVQVRDGRRTNFNPIVVNGAQLESLARGNLAYAESDVRSGSQVNVMFTRDYDLTGKSNIFLSFHSLYEQNQDSIGAVEYSIDQGATWLPILYMMAQADVVKNADGSVDAEATLNTARGDQAHELSYGSFIGTTVSPALAPYISERVDDDSYESKRVEVFRLSQADNQSKVRLRFMQAGTASWYFGVDDIGLYSIEQPLPPTITSQPVSQTASAGSTVSLKVAATGTGSLSYQWKFNGANLPGSTSSNLDIVNIQAAQAGNYSVIVSNAGGSVTSDTALIKVFSGTISQDLVVHLKFDNTLSDSSGKANHGEAVGNPSFVPGQVGSHALHIPSGSDYVSLGTPTDLNFGTATDFSISFWTRLTAWDGDPAFISNKDWNSGSNQGYVLATDDDGHFQWNLSGAPGSRKDYDGSPGTFSDTNWHHVVVTFERAGDASTYIDGALVNAKPINASENNLSTPEGFTTNIGQDGSGFYGSAFSDADMDDLGIWRRVLTPQEVSSIYSLGLKGSNLSQASGSPVTLGSIRITYQNGTLTLNWDGAGTLQKASELRGSWADVPTASSTYSEPANGQAFFRLIRR